MSEQVAGSSVTYGDVDSEEAGQRLDNYLLARLKGVPRSHVYQLIRSGQVRVNSGRANPRHRLKTGDRVRIPPVRLRSGSAKLNDPSGLGWLEACIVHEDERLIVVDKPAGLAVHGGTGLDIGCIEALRSLRPGLKTLELVHRLDRATSGCLMIAKRRSMLRNLHELLREGRVEKRYFALVKNSWQHGHIKVDLPLDVDHQPAGASVRVDAEGKTALTEFRLIEHCGGRASLVEAALSTGRTHQIRVHSAAMGHPIAGDERYGDADFNSLVQKHGLKRMFLHAHMIGFDDPNTGEPFAVSVPLPDDLRRFTDEFGRKT